MVGLQNEIGKIALSWLENEKRWLVMSNIKFFNAENIPLEMHKVRIVQKLNLAPIERRLEAIKEAGNKKFFLKKIKLNLSSFKIKATGNSNNTTKREAATTKYKIY